MNYKTILKCMKFISIAIMIVSLVEIINFALLGSSELNINGQMMSLQNFIYLSGLFPLNGILMWIFLFILTCSLIIIGAVMYQIARKSDFPVKTLTKYLIVIGIFTMVASFLKFEYIILIGNTEMILNSDTTTFQSVISNSGITPLNSTIMWNVFNAVACFQILIGLIITASSINWEIETVKREKLTKE